MEEGKVSVFCFVVLIFGVQRISGETYFFEADNGTILTIDTTKNQNATPPRAQFFASTECSTVLYLYCTDETGSDKPIVLTDQTPCSDLKKYFSQVDSVFVMCHGWVGKADGPCPQVIKDAICTINKKKNQTERRAVIAVDWPDSQLFYTDCVPKLPCVAESIARTLKRLIECGAIDPGRIDCCGHSLGCWLCGCISKRLPNKCRYGHLLDCAAPSMDILPKDERAVQNHFEYCQVLHTSECLATKDPVGHLDIYCNGGKNQPGCTFQDMMTCGGCSHNYVCPLFVKFLLCHPHSGTNCYCGTVSNAQKGACQEKDTFIAPNLDCDGRPTGIWYRSSTELDQKVYPGMCDLE